MRKKGLSASQEDYLESIYIISKEIGTVRTKGLAKKLKVSLPSVTEAVKRLSKNGLLKYKRYGSIVLTEKGRKKAKQIYHKHKTLFNFLVNVLKLNKETAEIDACKIEHALSQVTLNKLTKFLKKIN